MDFTKYLKGLKRSEATIVAYTKDLEQLADFVGAKDIKDINKKDLNNFVKDIINKRKFSKKTASRKINSFKTFFRYLEIKEILNENPSTKISHPEIEENHPRVLAQVEYKAIRDTARKNIRNYTMIELMLQTGMKIGEVSRLKLEDVKLNSLPPKIFIREHESNPLRVIDLNEIAIEIIKKYLKYRQKRPNDKGYLFNTRSGKNILIRNIRTAINRICRRAGVKAVRVNDFRNTFIAHQIENGLKLDKIAEFVGHKRSASTEKYLAVTERKTPGDGTDIVPL